VCCAAIDFVNAAGFAQTFPDDKHMIAKALQGVGAIVGMTVRASSA
jgi:hypothetical protein